MIDIEKFKDIGEEYMEWTFTKRPTKLWIDTDYGRAVIDTKKHEGTTASWYLEDEAKLMAEAPRLLAEVKRLRVIEEQRRRMGNVLADYCINDVCDEFFEGDYSFYEKLAKAYGWKEGDEE